MYVPTIHTSRKSQSANALTRKGRKRNDHRLSLRLESLEERVLLSEVPQLVKDINLRHTPSPSYGNPGVVMNGISYFAADDGVDGNQLWRSDGTAAGTYMLTDVNSSGEYRGINPGDLIVVNQTLFFTATNEGIVHGEPVDTQLWKTDGTTAGTVMLTDTNSSGGGIGPQELFDVNGTLYFAANDGAHGTELWESDGTAAGTMMVKDINPGIYGSYPSNFLNASGTLYFTATDRIHKTQLWKSDGTAAGTVMVQVVPDPPTYGSSPSDLLTINGTIYFTANDGIDGIQLWKSDGTANGTVALKTLFFPPNGAEQPLP